MNKIFENEYYSRSVVKANNISEALLIELDRLSFPDEYNEEHIEYLRCKVLKYIRPILK